jgi:hypothetical protein
MSEKAAASSDVKVVPLFPRIFEATMWTLAISIYFLWYNGVGELAKMRGVDYTQYFITKYDLEMPSFCWTIIPYVGTYALPFLYVFAIWRYKSFDMGYIRRAWAAQFIMISVGYVLFYYVPIQIGPIADKFLAGDTSGLFEHWTVQFVHKGMSQFCAWPSMHVANIWYDSYVFNEQDVPGKRAVRWLAYSQFLATIGTRAHYLMDLPSGVILAELTVRLVYLPMERRRLWSEPKALSPSTLPWLLLAPAILTAGLQWINTATGWGGVANIFS